MLTVGSRNHSDREHWLESTLKRVRPGARILDAGAGECQYKRFCGHLDYVSQDFSQYDGSGDGKALQMKEWDQSRIQIVSDILNIPEPAQSFDAVMCIEVFEHLPAPIGAIQEFARLLKPGGELIVTAPFCSLSHFTPYFFYTGFSAAFYRTHLEANGFEIEEIRHNGNFFEYLAQELGRLPQIGGDYSRPGLGMLIRVLSLPLRFVLQFLSKHDRGSSELLCFGLMVRARRKKNG